MKRVLCLLLAVFMLFSLVACGNTTGVDTQKEEAKDMSDPENWLVDTHAKGEAIVEQTAVNECCRYSNVKSVLGFEIGNQEFDGYLPAGSTWEGKYYSNPTIMYKNITGSYFPKDQYGDMGDKHYFRMTIYIDAMTGEGIVIDSDIGRYK